MLEHLLARGWLIEKNLFTTQQILAARSIPLVPQRGQDLEGRYWFKNSGADQPSLSLWWAGQLTDAPELQPIIEKVLAHGRQTITDLVVYSVDIITNEPSNRLMFPHVDSPYRFEPWASQKDLLALQYIMPLQPVDSNNGATALVPHSWRYTWPIDKCYAHAYDDFFKSNMVQPSMEIGDCLIYHPNILHSAMPNFSTAARLALLVSLMDPSVAKRLKYVDNIWKD